MSVAFSQKRVDSQNLQVRDTVLIINLLNQSANLANSSVDSALLLSEIAIKNQMLLHGFVDCTFKGAHADHLKSKKKFLESTNFYMDAIEALYEVEPQSANKQNVRYLKGTYFDTRRAVLVSLKLSECLNQLKSFHKSDSILRNALILSNNYNDRDLSFKVKEAQSLFYEISKDFVKAIYLRNEICKDYIKIKATTKALTQCEYIGDLCVRIKDYDQAIEFYEKALTIFDGRQHPDKVIVFSKKIKATKSLKIAGKIQKAFR
ncbi:MAG: hypothetical protein IPL22_14670 [Bacteroidetes bacterium]|nr:hypothetical protein [Bacteroidota bacterium]